MAKRKKQAGSAIPEWVVTYGDMMSLLLCFFILLSAFSELKKPREYQRVIDSIKEALGLDGGQGLVRTERDPTFSSNRILREFAKLDGPVMAESDVNEESTPGRDHRVQVLRNSDEWAVSGRIDFTPASTELSELAKDRLRDVADQIRGRTFKVDVRGHAWGLEDKSAGDSYRDISYKRARAAAAFLENECGVRPELLNVVAAGNGEPLSTDRLDQGAVAQNRRVEVIVTETTIAEVHRDPDWQGN